MSYISRITAKKTQAAAGTEQVITTTVPPGKQWKILYVTIAFTLSKFPLVYFEFGKTGTVWTHFDGVACPTRLTTRTGLKSWIGPFIVDGGETVNLGYITNVAADVVYGTIIYEEMEGPK